MTCTTFCREAQFPLQQRIVLFARAHSAKKLGALNDMHMKTRAGPGTTEANTDSTVDREFRPIPAYCLLARRPKHIDTGCRQDVTRRDILSGPPVGHHIALAFTFDQEQQLARPTKPCGR